MNLIEVQLILLATTQLFSSTQRSAWRPNGFSSERKLAPRAVVVHDPQSGASRFMASGCSHSTTYIASLECTTCIETWDIEFSILHDQRLQHRIAKPALDAKSMGAPYRRSYDATLWP